MGGQPGDGIPSCILMLKGFLESSKEVVPGPEDHGSAGNCIFLESISPGQSRPFGHVQESKGNFLCVHVVGCFIDCKVELNGVHPGDHHLIGAIKGFGFAKLQLSRLYGSGQHGGGDRWTGVRRYDWRSRQ